MLHEHQKMHDMKNIVQIQSVLLLLFFVTLPYFLITQEEAEKQVRVKTVKESDGKVIVRDTTFTAGSDKDIEAIVKEYMTDMEADTAADVMVDVFVDEVGGATGKGGQKKVIIRKGDGEEEVILLPHGHGPKVMKFKSGDGKDEKIIVVTPQGGHKVIRWKSGDGEAYEFDYEFDFDEEMLREEMARVREQMYDLQMDLFDEQGKLAEELVELKKLEDLEELERLKELEYIMVMPEPGQPEFFHEFHRNKSRGMEVSDEELRDAGIKNKPDRLELDDIDVRKEEGVVDLSFTMAEEGNPKVDVYNIYGEKVFSGKPELMNNKYQIKMDLSKKQYGTYYMQIVSGSSSKTLRLKL